MINSNGSTAHGIANLHGRQHWFEVLDVIYGEMSFVDFMLDGRLILIALTFPVSMKVRKLSKRPWYRGCNQVTEFRVTAQSYFRSFESSPSRYVQFQVQVVFN